MSDPENPKAILQRICSEKDPEHWAPAFTNFLLNHPSDTELAEYAKNLIFHEMLREGSESNLSSMISYPVSVDWVRDTGFLESEYHRKALVHLPANQIFGSTHPVRECFIKALEGWLGENFGLSKQLEKTEDFIEKYINTPQKVANLRDSAADFTQKVLKVAMLPYHDTLMIPMLLEAVNKSTEKFKIDFNLHYFPDVSNNLAARRLHINFLSESKRVVLPSHEFSTLREENTEIVLLRHKKSEDLKNIKHFYNYQGYYGNAALRLAEGSSAQAAPILTEDAPNFYEREIDVLLALAAGLFNKEIAVIPSIQGYLWSKDTGLHFREDLGGTLCHDSINSSTSNKNDTDKFGIAALGDNEEAKNLAFHLAQTAEDLRKEFTKCLHEGASKEKAAALLLTPILTRYPKYSGLLTNISSQLLTRMLEVESDYTKYQPDWLCNKESRPKAASK